MPAEEALYGPAPWAVLVMASMVRDEIAGIRPGGGAAARVTFAEALAAAVEYEHARAHGYTHTHVVVGATQGHGGVRIHYLGRRGAAAAGSHMTAAALFSRCGLTFREIEVERPPQCVEHDDCAESRELGEACWAGRHGPW